MYQVASMIKSQDKKVANADKFKLTATGRAIYLRGLACVSKCEEVAKSGNKGRGFTVKPLVLPIPDKTVV